MERIGILNSGGDCPGLNAVIRGVVQTASLRGLEVVGIRDGFEGLLLGSENCEVLDHKTVSGILPLGGTILGTTNKGHFASVRRSDGEMAVPSDVLDQAVETYTSLNLRALIVIGGNGSLTTTMQLAERGLKVIAIPKTIDNDLAATSFSFGFNSAVKIVCDALDNIHTTAASHRRVMVVEVMGRNAGWIALHGGMAGGANVILIPEIPFDYEKIVETIEKRRIAGRRCTIIVVAEGAKPRGGQMIRHTTSHGERRLGGIGETVAATIGSRIAQEVRTCTLGHLQRGCPPMPFDRMLATAFGVYALDLVAAERYGVMITYQNLHIADIPISYAVHRMRRVNPKNDFLRLAKSLGICFGD